MFRLPRRFALALLLGVLLCACACLQGQEGEVLARLADSVQGNPQDIALRLQFARSLGISKRFTEASAQYAIVLQQDPNNLAARVGMARLASWQGNFGAAFAAYDEILRRTPNLYDAIVGKAFTLSWMGRTDEALPLLRRAARMHPEDGEVAAEIKRLGGAVPVRISSSPQSIPASPKIRKHEAAPAPKPPETVVYPQTFAEPVAPAKAIGPEHSSALTYMVGLGTAVVVGAAVILFVRRPAARAFTSAETVHSGIPLPDAQDIITPAARPSPKILLLESNEDAAQFLRLFYERAGASVSRCKDVGELAARLPHEKARAAVVAETCTATDVERLFSVKPGDTELVFACANLEESQLFRARGCATVSKPFRLAELGALLVGSADRKISRSIG